MTLHTDPEVALPHAVAALFDGENLDRKIGQTVSLVAAEHNGWPHLALLSVGEVVTTSGSDIRLALYAGSGTTAALTRTGRALLSLVVDAAYYKIRAAVSAVTMTDDDGLAYFHGQVIRVDEDRVGYARIVSGVAYELVEPPRIVARWRQQVDALRRIAP